MPAKKAKGADLRFGGHIGEHAGYQGIHDPVRRGADTLALRAHARREDFRDVHPNDGALRDRKEDDEQHEHPDQRALVCMRVEDEGDAGESECHADGPDEQESLAAELVDEAHAEEAWPAD